MARKLMVFIYPPHSGVTSAIDFNDVLDYEAVPDRTQLFS
jgi:hypothetical protein